MSAVLFFLGCLGSVITWISSIRPYVLKHQEGNNTGASLGVAMWVDWQKCGEISKQQEDPRGLVMYRTFGIFQIVGVIGFVMLLS